MQGTTDNIYIQMILGMCGAFILVVSFILFSIRNQNRLLRQRQQFQAAEIAHQKELLGAVIQSQETERKRIGQDLHDDVGTTLSGLRLLIEMFKPVDDKDQQYLNFVKSGKLTIDKIVKDVRHISHNLSPATLGYYGLAAAINEHSDIINQSGKLTVNVVNDADAILENLPLANATALYRVLEELMNNTIKHSGASKADIQFNSTPGKLLIAYKDNGKGLSGSTSQLKKGMGMQNIESRLLNINATYDVTTKPGEGFHIHINYPVI
ncbi:histidine kinase [Mucilaginibacter sp.]|uniref:sensor histidine kinase n=1 Tax=Mucilaginibacter sp. TaxID=1882438 RepID=UPI003264AE71